MDFMSKLPCGSYGIWFIVDQLTKSAHFVPIQISFSIERLAHICVCKIVHLYGVLYFHGANRLLKWAFTTLADRYIFKEASCIDQTALASINHLSSSLFSSHIFS